MFFFFKKIQKRGFLAVSFFLLPPLIKTAMESQRRTASYDAVAAKDVHRSVDQLVLLSQTDPELSSAALKFQLEQAASKVQYEQRRAAAAAVTVVQSCCLQHHPSVMAAGRGGGSTSPRGTSPRNDPPGGVSTSSTTSLGSLDAAGLDQNGSSAAVPTRPLRSPTVDRSGLGNRSFHGVATSAGGATATTSMDPVLARLRRECPSCDGVIPEAVMLRYTSQGQMQVQHLFDTLIRMLDLATAAANRCLQRAQILAVSGNDPFAPSSSRSASSSSSSHTVVKPASPVVPIVACKSVPPAVSSSSTFIDVWAPNALSDDVSAREALRKCEGRQSEECAREKLGVSNQQESTYHHHASAATAISGNKNDPTCGVSRGDALSSPAPALHPRILEAASFTVADVVDAPTSITESPSSALSSPPYHQTEGASMLFSSQPAVLPVDSVTCAAPAVMGAGVTRGLSFVEDGCGLEDKKPTSTMASPHHGGGELPPDSFISNSNAGIGGARSAAAASRSESFEDLTEDLEGQCEYLAHVAHFSGQTLSGVFLVSHDVRPLLQSYIAEHRPLLLDFLRKAITVDRKTELYCFAEGYKTTHMSVLANLCSEAPLVAQLVAEDDALMVAILNATRVDEENPGLAEWAEFAIRNLCHSSDAAQQRITSLMPSSRVGTTSHAAW